MRTNKVSSDLSSNDENADEGVSAAHDERRVNDREGHDNTGPHIPNTMSEFENFWTGSTFDLPMDLYFGSIGTDIEMSTT